MGALFVRQDRHVAERVKRASGVTPEIALTPRDEIFKPGDTLKSKRFVDLRREAG